MTQVLAALMLAVTLSGAHGSLGDGYETTDKAAQAALTLAAELSNNTQECGGVIYKVEDRYYYTYPVCDGKSFGVSLEHYAQGWNTVADYHVHICSIHNRPFANFFSSSDADVDSGLHIVGYMLSLCDHNIRRYDPSQDDRDDEEVDFKPHKDGSKLILYLTIGHISGWVDPRRRVATARSIPRKSTLLSSQSWDQENLKKGDHGCPTAVFVAPNGNLEQCP